MQHPEVLKQSAHLPVNQVFVTTEENLYNQTSTMKIENLYIFLLKIHINGMLYLNLILVTQEEASKRNNCTILSVSKHARCTFISDSSKLYTEFEAQYMIRSCQ